jgi:NADH-quinone oxidoreductase subunit J
MPATSWLDYVFFFIGALGAVAGALGVVLLRNAFYSVLALVCHLISLAVLFLLLRAEFVAAAQVIVYAGAVMVLYVFVVAYVGGGEEVAAGAALRVLGPMFAVAVAVELCLAMLGSALKGISTMGARIHVPGFGTPRHIGQLFLTTYLFPFEVASLVLLVAAVGAVVLARRRRGLEPDEALARRMMAPRPLGTGTMAEGGGVLHPLPAVEEIGPAAAGPAAHSPATDRGALAQSALDREGGW